MEAILPLFQFWYFWFPACTPSAGPASTEQSRGGESGCPVLAPRTCSPRATFQPSAVSRTSAVGLSCVAFVTLRCIPSLPRWLTVFVTNGRWILSNAFFASIEVVIGFLMLLLLRECITSIDLGVLNHPCIPGVNPTCSWWMTLLMRCWLWSASIFIGDFCIFVHLGYWPIVFYIGFL